MTRKIVIISLLAIALTLLLIFRPWETEKPLSPRFEDRFSNAEVYGKINVLSFADKLSMNLYYYNSPLKDYVSSDFLLSQGKNYGLDVQSPVYFILDKHSNDQGIDVGFYIRVKNSIKLSEGLNRISNIIGLKQIQKNGNKLYYQEEFKIYIAYGKDWMLVYSGNKEKANSVIEQAFNAKLDDVTLNWNTFLSDSTYKNLDFIAESESTRLKNRGINSAKITFINDSTSISFVSEMTTKEPTSIKVKEQGYQLEEQKFTKTLINLHLDISKVKKNNADPFYSLMKEFGSKISFPVDEFLRAWDGELAVRQGGIHTVQESYIVSEMDDDFNVIEVEKTHDIKIPGMSIYLSTNENGKSFYRKLFSKGIMTHEGDKERLLFLPPLNNNMSDSSWLLYTANYEPKLLPSYSNHVMWNFEKMPILFFLDSTKTYSIFGRVELPFDDILQLLKPEK